MLHCNLFMTSTPGEGFILGTLEMPHSDIEKYRIEEREKIMSKVSIKNEDQQRHVASRDVTSRLLSFLSCSIIFTHFFNQFGNSRSDSSNSSKIFALFH